MPVTSLPAADEYGPSYAAYVARVAGVTAPLEELVAQRARLLDFLLPLSDQQALFRYDAGKWSVKELVGHMADGERIFAYRMLRVGRGDTTPLPGFEENDYVPAGAFDARPFSTILDEWGTVRDATVSLAAGLPADAWTRRGTVNDAAVSARALLYMILGHVEHHREVLEQRYKLPARV